MVTTRRQWLFKNPPPHTAEVYESSLRDAREGLRDAIAETSGLVIELVGTSAIRARKASPEPARASIKDKVRGLLKGGEKHEKKLLEIAKRLFVEYPKGQIETSDDWEIRGVELLNRLDQFQIEQSRALIHYIRETKLWREKIANLKEKMAAAAQCPIDGAPLMRTRNRKEDLFVCTAPIVEDRPQHYFLWTLVDGKPGLKEVDLAKDTLPDIDAPMEVPDGAK